MSFSYSEDFVEEVRLNNDIVDLISEYTNLERSGKSYKGLCPFHDENTPSFFVNPDQQLYYCFGCSVGGDVFNFIMDIEGLGFRESIKLLAERSGITLPELNTTPKEKEKQDEKREVLKIHKLAARFYNYLLLESDLGEEAKEYLSARGFTEDTIKEFKLGFAPNRWGGLYRFLKKKGYSDRLLAKAGLILSRKDNNGYYDRFRNRIIFSIFDYRGQVIGFGGRIIEETNQPKYLNSPETIIFDKSRNLYGLNLAKKFIQQKKEAIIVEGYTDVITAYQYGIKNTVASLGTALTSQQAKLLKRYADTVYISYDSDTAGARATLRGLDILRKEGLTVKVIKLPDQLDPDEFIKKFNKEGFAQFKADAKSLVEFKLNSVLDKINLNSVDDKIKAIKGILPILVEIRNEVELNEYCKKVATKLNTDLKVLKKELKKYRLKKRGQDRKSNYRNNINKSDLKESLNDPHLQLHLKAVNELLIHIIRNPNLIDKIKDYLQPKDFIKDEYKRLVTVIFDSYKQTGSLDVKKILEKIEDRVVKNLLLQLSVNQENGLNYTEDMVCDLSYIKRIKEYQVVMRIKNLDLKIKQAQDENNIDKERRLLQEKVQLLRKEGI